MQILMLLRFPNFYSNLIYTRLAILRKNSLKWRKIWVKRLIEQKKGKTAAKPNSDNMTTDYGVILI